MTARVTVPLTALALAGGIVLLWLLPTLAGSPEFKALGSASPDLASYVRGWLVGSLLLGAPLLAQGGVNLFELHGWVRRRGPTGGTPPPHPFDPGKTNLVVGVVHEQEGAPSSDPDWLVLPEAGLFAHALVTGSTGAGKTRGVMEPSVKQFIAFHHDDAERKWAGLVIDAKGNWVDDIQRWCEAQGRGDDFYAIRLPDARTNLINRPDLNKMALAGALWRGFENIGGGSSDNKFWGQSATTLAAQTLRLIALCGEIPSLDLVYRVSCSERAFAGRLETARSRAGGMSDDEQAELESLMYWYQNVLLPMDGKTRSNIAATLNALCALFDEPEIKRSFCARPEEETFPGFPALIREGKVVVVSIPEGQYKQVSAVVSTLVKLNYFDAVTQRLARAGTVNAELGRACFFVADEFDKYVTLDDPTFFSVCREARCACVVATQAYSGFKSKLHDEAKVAMLLGNLRTKIWLCLEDNDTAEEAARLCGKVDREKVTQSRSEAAQAAAFSVVDRQAIREGQSTASASTSWTTREEYLFRPRAFTNLQAGQAIVKAFDGTRVLPPWVVYLDGRPADAGPLVPTKVQ